MNAFKNIKNWKSGILGLVAVSACVVSQTGCSQGSDDSDIGDSSGQESAVLLRDIDELGRQLGLGPKLYEVPTDDRPEAHDPLAGRCVGIYIKNTPDTSVGKNSILSYTRRHQNGAMFFQSLSGDVLCADVDLDWATRVSNPRPPLSDKDAERPEKLELAFETVLLESIYQFRLASLSGWHRVAPRTTGAALETVANFSRVEPVFEGPGQEDDAEGAGRISIRHPQEACYEADYVNLQPLHGEDVAASPALTGLDAVTKASIIAGVSTMAECAATGKLIHRCRLLSAEKCDSLMRDDLRTKLLRLRAPELTDKSRGYDEDAIVEMGIDAPPTFYGTIEKLNVIRNGQRLEVPAAIISLGYRYRGDLGRFDNLTTEGADETYTFEHGSITRSGTSYTVRVEGEVIRTL